MQMYANMKTEQITKLIRIYPRPVCMYKWREGFQQFGNILKQKG